LNRIVLATRNAAKLEELARILAEAGLPLQVCGVAQFADVPEVAETGRTFAENALLKARAVATATGVPAVADGSRGVRGRGRAAPGGPPTTPGCAWTR
jgi:XTP/dITP diphosphohydrolase